MDAGSDLLIDRTGRKTIGVTDPNELTIYISDILEGEQLKRVVIHELGHCAMWSYGILEDVHRMTRRECWIEMEELICNVLAEYGSHIFDVCSRFIGGSALYMIPKCFDERLG